MSRYGDPGVVRSDPEKGFGNAQSRCHCAIRNIGLEDTWEANCRLEKQKEFRHEFRKRHEIMKLENSERGEDVLLRETCSTPNLLSCHMGLLPVIRLVGKMTRISGVLYMNMVGLEPISEFNEASGLKKTLRPVQIARELYVNLQASEKIAVAIRKNTSARSTATLDIQDEVYHHWKGPAQRLSGTHGPRVVVGLGRGLILMRGGPSLCKVQRSWARSKNMDHQEKGRAEKSWENSGNSTDSGNSGTATQGMHGAEIAPWVQEVQSPSGVIVPVHHQEEQEQEPNAETEPSTSNVELETPSLPATIVAGS